MGAKKNIPFQQEKTREQRQIDIRNQMDLLVTAYNQHVSNATNDVITGSIPKTSLNQQMFLNFLNSPNTYTTNKATESPNSFLFRAKTPEQFLEMAGEKKRNYGMFGSTRMEYDPDKLEAANQLFNQAKASSLVGGTNFFDFSTNVSDAEVKKRYNFSKFEASLAKELEDKYNSLGGYERGLLANDTVETTDDEKVLFKTAAPPSSSRRITTN